MMTFDEANRFNNTYIIASRLELEPADVYDWLEKTSLAQPDLRQLMKNPMALRGSILAGKERSNSR